MGKNSDKESTQKFVDTGSKVETAKSVSTPSATKSRIAVVLKNFTKASDICPQYWHRSVKGWSKNQIIRDESEINELISVNAPIEIFYKDAN